MPDSTFSLVDARGRKDLTAGERERFLAAVRTHPKPAVQTLAHTLAMTGARVSVDLEAREVRIATLKRRRSHWRAVPVPEALPALELDPRPQTGTDEPQRRTTAPVAHHPPDREPPGGRTHAHRRHRGPASLHPGAFATRTA